MNDPADVERVGGPTSDATRRSLAWLAGFALGWELATATARIPPARPPSANPPTSTNHPTSSNQPAGAHRAGAA